MMGHKVAHISDLTEAEVKVVGALTDGLPHTQKEITEGLGIAQSTLSERLKSIMAKSPIVTEDLERGRKLYSINSNMNIDAGYWQNLELIHLKIDSEEAYRRQQIALSSCYRYLIGIPIGIIINNSNRIPSSLSVNPGGVLALSQCGVCFGLKKERDIYPPAQTTDNAQNQQQEPLSDTDKSDQYEPIRTDNASIQDCGIPIRSSGGFVHKKGLNSNHLVWVRFLKDYRTAVSIKLK
jgi:DNA-binding CsgD family transcriptional regulator